MKPRKYESPADFKQAVEQRLRSGSQSGTDFARRRQLLVFDLFLARVAQVMGDAATLKGGLVLELRLEHARTTKDIDLRLMGSPDDILEKLQNAARLNRVTFWASSLRNPGTRSIEDWQRKIPWNGRRSNAVLAEAISLMVKATIYSAQWAAAGRKRALTKLAAMTDLEKEREILLLRERIAQQEQLIAILQRQIQDRGKKHRFQIRERMAILWCLEYFEVPRCKVQAYFGASRASLSRAHLARR